MGLARVDHRTVDYFDQHGSEYSPRRLDRAIELINERVTERAALVDIGCGTGNVLSYVAERIGARRLVGLDTSSRCVRRAREATGAEVHESSILDPCTIERFSGQFDVAIMSAILHHLVSATRRGSRRLAKDAVLNAVHLLKPGGYLLIVEPTFSPSAMATILFWVKRVLSTMTANRVTIGGQWNNLGAPVVSFYRPGEVRHMAERGGTIEIFETTAEPLGRLAALVFTKTSTTVVVRRTSRTD